MTDPSESGAPQTVLLEGMTSISAVLDPAVSAFNDRRVLSVLLDRERHGRKSRDAAFLRRRAAEAGFSVRTVDPGELDRLTSGRTHGGVAAICSRRTLPTLRDRLGSVRRDGFYALLDGIEDPYNFGYTLRSLYAAGTDGVVLPPRNWMAEAGLVARSSAGASERMPLYVCPPAEAVPLLRGIGYRAAAAGIRDAVCLYEADLSLPLLLVIGGEKRGISRATLAETDFRVRIPYRGRFRGSLPSAASAAVLAFEVLRRNAGRGADDRPIF